MKKNFFKPPLDFPFFMKGNLRWAKSYRYLKRRNKLIFSRGGNITIKRWANQPFSFEKIIFNLNGYPPNPRGFLADISPKIKYKLFKIIYYNSFIKFIILSNIGNISRNLHQQKPIEILLRGILISKSAVTIAPCSSIRVTVII